jgi:hypothetical protein
MPLGHGQRLSATYGPAAGRGGEAGRSKLKAFRNRVLAIPHRVEYLSARQTLALTQELRACLDELADDAAPYNLEPPLVALVHARPDPAAPHD